MSGSLNPLCAALTTIQNAKILKNVMVFPQLLNKTSINVMVFAHVFNKTSKNVMFFLHALKTHHKISRHLAQTKTSKTV